MSIESIRNQIDILDKTILQLLNSRAELAIEIGRIKKKISEPVYNPDREKEILDKLVTINEGPLDNKSIKSLFERIIDESRSIERKISEMNMIPKND